jgi:hypothetical protein
LQIKERKQKVVLPHSLGSLYSKIVGETFLPNL